MGWASPSTTWSASGLWYVSRGSEDGQCLRRPQQLVTAPRDEPTTLLPAELDIERMSTGKATGQPPPPGGGLCFRQLSTSACRSTDSNRAARPFQHPPRGRCLRYGDSRSPPAPEGSAPRPAYPRRGVALGNPLQVVSSLLGFSGSSRNDMGLHPPCQIWTLVVQPCVRLPETP